MILGIGFDLVEVGRISSAIERWGDKFIFRILTERERDLASKDIVRYVASRFAAKEAFVKALGTGFSQGVSLQHIEIIPGQTTPPQIELNARASYVAHQLGVKKIFLSISHEKNIAGAMVVLEG
ncbi:holo-ACP synthase [Desulfothermus sp.]